MPESSTNNEDDDTPSVHSAEDDNSDDGGHNMNDIQMVIIDTNGIFHHTIQPCSCPSVHQDVHIQLLRMGLFSATLIKPSTAFTFNLLDYFYVEPWNVSRSMIS
jgi:hypothetical protein